MTARLLNYGEGPQAAGPERGYVLKIAVIRQESLPREWTTQVSRHAIHLVGPRSVRTASWGLEELREPAALHAATEAAIGADILIVAVNGAGGLPSAVNDWIDSWLPHRLQREGALVAVIGVHRPATALAMRTRAYLHNVAAAAQLDFLSQERRLPAARSGLWGKAPGIQLGPRLSGEIFQHHQGLPLQG